jgi:hypothetical protein
MSKKMKKFIFIFAIPLTLLCNTGVKSQIQDVEERTQKEMVNTADWFYDRFKDFGGDFDRECFLIGTLDDNNGHYQTFTANKSVDDINDKVRWVFRKDLKFMPDTMRCQRITAYKSNDIILALFVTTLFKNDYPDFRALRVCSLYPLVRHYGSEVKSTADRGDPVCNSLMDIDIEIFSSSLAKKVADYYNFDYDYVSAVSSGGDIGYRGVINKEKIATEAQKLSFLAGIFLSYGWQLHPDGNSYSTEIPNSLSTTKEFVDILKEFGCDDVREVSTVHIQCVTFKASDKIRVFISVINDLFQKISGVMIVF